MRRGKGTSNTPSLASILVVSGTMSWSGTRRGYVQFLFPWTRWYTRELFTPSHLSRSNYCDDNASRTFPTLCVIAWRRGDGFPPSLLLLLLDARSSSATFCITVALTKQLVLALYRDCLSDVAACFTSATDSSVSAPKHENCSNFLKITSSP